MKETGKNPKIFIIILNYNGKDCVLKTLSDVFKINYPNFEIVLVDNNSTDGSLEMIRFSFPKLVLIKNSENLGFSAGNNIGIKYALERGADYVLLLNYDVRVLNNFLSPLAGAMEKNEKIGIASPTILEGESSKIWFSGGKINWLQMKAKHKTNKLSKDYLKSDYISGCAMLIRKEVFKKIGLLDEDYFLYWEDADFSVKARRKGFKLLVSSQSVIRHLEKSQEKKERKIYWLVLSGLIFFKKNARFYLKPWIFLYILVRKIKNFKDIKNNPNSIALAVQKAYQDFKYAK